jgi:uracil phosphoribosyltransferase
VDLITKLIARQLEERGLSFRQRLADLHRGKNYLPSNLIQVKESPQIKSILTIIRSHETDRTDFIFFSNRLCSIVVETGLSELTFKRSDVTTPTGSSYSGLAPAKKLCGVSIERAGVAMERGLRKVCKDIKIGKILIQTDKATGDPKVSK